MRKESTSVGWVPKPAGTYITGMYRTESERRFRCPILVPLRLNAWAIDLNICPLGLVEASPLHMIARYIILHSCGIRIIWKIISRLRKFTWMQVGTTIRKVEEDSRQQWFYFSNKKVFLCNLALFCGSLFFLFFEKKLMIPNPRCVCECVCVRSLGWVREGCLRERTIIERCSGTSC